MVPQTSIHSSIEMQVLVSFGWESAAKIDSSCYFIFFFFCIQFFLDVRLKWTFKLDLIISKGQINKSTIIFVIVQKVFPSWKKIMEKFRLQQKARFYSFQRDRGPSTVHVIITYIANQIFRQTHLHLWLKVWSKSIKNSAVICFPTAKSNQSSRRIPISDWQNPNRKITRFGFFCIYIRWFRIF